MATCDFSPLCRVLDNNLLMGTIPYQLSTLTNLIMLNLSVNELSGPIPPEIGNLTSITKLYEVNSLQKFSLTTTFILFPYFSNLFWCRFMYRDLHSNRLNGYIPPELGDLTKLFELRLDRNKLSGVIPASNVSNM